MSLFDDRFASKNAASARAWAVEDEKNKKEKRHEPSAPKTGVCDKCHREMLVKAYRTRQADVGNGAASFGMVIKYFCEDCAPKFRREKDETVPQLDKKQVRNLMRSAKKGLL